MLSVELVLEIRRLLEEGDLSQRAVAARVGVSRGTVDGIANGRRGLYGRDPACRAPQHEATAIPKRCRGCGGLVYEPCLLCRARNYWLRVQEIRRVLRSTPRTFGKRSLDWSREDEAA